MAIEKETVDLVDHIKRLQKEQPSDWILIDPQGRLYAGDIHKVTRILFLNHPYSKGLT
jgi:hypothetical protein